MIPRTFQDSYFPVGILLSSNRALVDARRGYEKLKAQHEDGGILFSDWRVQWIGVCALLRASVHLFQSDAKACLNKRITDELSNEWKSIKENDADHEIYWKFINKERNAVLKEYHWTAYEAYFDELGEDIPASKIGIFSMVDPTISKKLHINSGNYKGQDAFQVLELAIAWLEERISSALARAGFHLDDKAHFKSWQKMQERTSLIGSDDLLTIVEKAELEG
ncbi:MAG: hypothetical protein AAF601_03895 [Pseudomonadota bacterium]